MPFAQGQTVYVASELKYYGKGTVERLLEAPEDSGVADKTGTPLATYAVLIGNRRGRIAEDQIFLTAADARANATQTIWQS